MTRRVTIIGLSTKCLRLLVTDDIGIVLAPLRLFVDMFLICRLIAGPFKLHLKENVEEFGWVLGVFKQAENERPKCIVSVLFFYFCKAKL